MRIGLSRYGTSDPGLKSKPSDRMVYYAGHDINIYFVRVLLGLCGTRGRHTNLRRDGAV